MSNNSEKVPTWIKRICNKFTSDKVILLGDIQINEDEYSQLISYLKSYFLKLDEIKENLEKNKVTNPFISLALIQIGQRYYDSKGFWPYVANEIGVDKITGEQQGILGRVFYNTMFRYKKLYISKSDYVNNIMMHCFVSDSYIFFLFDFLFTYYRIDLERDLLQNKGERKNALIHSMKQGETAKRSQKIKRHTSDAVAKNERGCRQRINSILRMMDNALFYDILPVNSQKRIAKYFCEWAKKSIDFDNERKICRNNNYNRGQKSFNTPYVKFDTKSETYRIVLPKQYIHKDIDTDNCNIFWKVITKKETIENPVCLTEGIAGVMTDEIDDIVLDSNLLLSEICFELWNGINEKLKSFSIGSDSIRFFDKNWNMLSSATYKQYFPVGQIYALSKDKPLSPTCSGDKPRVEKAFGYFLSEIVLKIGDVVILPNGKGRSVGKPLEEGLLSNYLVPGIKMKSGDEFLDVYNTVPSFFFRMRPDQENGTLFIVNGKRIKFGDDNCQRIDLDEITDEKGYIFNPAQYIVDEVECSVKIDVPNSRKNRYYHFSVIDKLDYRFDKPLYVFDSTGSLMLTCNESLSLIDPKNAVNNNYNFNITPGLNEIDYMAVSAANKYHLVVTVPVMKWKLVEDYDWETIQPNELFAPEFNEIRNIILDIPCDKIRLFMSPLVNYEEPNDDSSEESFSMTVNKNSEKGYFVCDTRKMLSWIGREEYERKLYIASDCTDNPIQFLTVLTKNKALSFDYSPDYRNGKMYFTSTIHGIMNYKADVYFNDTLICEKKDATYRGFNIDCNLQSGTYRVEFYQVAEDEFGIEDLYCFYKKQFDYVNPYDISGKEIYILSAMHTRNIDSFFAGAAHTLRNVLNIYDITKQEQNEDSDAAENSYTFYGNCLINNERTRVKIRLRISEVNERVSPRISELSFEDDGDFYDFYYDNMSKSLQKEEDDKLKREEKKKRYTLLYADDYEFTYKIKENI